MNPNLPLSTSLLTSFYLSPHEIKACDKYVLIYWQSRYIYTQLLKSPRIMKDKIPFTPIFQEGVTELELQMNPDKQFKLSFRKILGAKTGYVLIRRVRCNIDGMAVS
jgi:hypothetical protein